MALERTQDVLRLLERAAAEHLGWLMRVHHALMFPDGTKPSCADSPLPALCDAACGVGETLGPLVRLRGEMHHAADRLLAQALRDGRVDPEGYHAFMAAVDAYSREARRMETHFRRLLVETDPLTGVSNRQGMMRALRREWTRSLRTGRPCCIAVADLDWFKAVNDTWGHQAGDRVLCMAARFFLRRLRPYDMVFRYGGEEFLFCLPDTDAATTEGVLDRVREELANTTVTLDCGTRITVTCSIGVAQMEADSSVQDTIEAADRALYAAKAAGRNRVELARPAPPPEARSVASIALAGSLNHGTIRH